MADGPEVVQEWDYTSEGEPPAALLRRAISHVESLLHRLDQERPVSHLPPLEADAARDDADGDVPRPALDRLLEIEASLAQVRTALETDRRDAVKVLNRSTTGAAELRQALIGIVATLGDCVAGLDESAGSLEVLIAESNAG